MVAKNKGDMSGGEILLDEAKQLVEAEQLVLESTVEAFYPTNKWDEVLMAVVRQLDRKESVWGYDEMMGCTQDRVSSRDLEEDNSLAPNCQLSVLLPR